MIVIFLDFISALPYNQLRPLHSSHGLKTMLSNADVMGTAAAAAAEIFTSSGLSLGQFIRVSWDSIMPRSQMGAITDSEFQNEMANKLKAASTFNDFAMLWPLVYCYNDDYLYRFNTFFDISPKLNYEYIEKYKPSDDIDIVTYLVNHYLSCSSDYGLRKLSDLPIESIRVSNWLYFVSVHPSIHSEILELIGNKLLQEDVVLDLNYAHLTSYFFYNMEKIYQSLPADSTEIKNNFGKWYSEIRKLLDDGPLIENLSKNVYSSIPQYQAIGKNGLVQNIPETRLDDTITVRGKNPPFPVPIRTPRGNSLWGISPKAGNK
eukprot:NODE_54_length_26799_cov_0.554794.p7 type:complete len:319 gc:universal NODE_54_length_26799_cov_0.554794:6186-7142(+)